MDSALAGIRVLDVATLYPAPLLAAILGDLGADVVKVEPATGDPLRSFGAVPWAIAGRNKRSVTVDVDHAEGVALLGRLAGVADVVVFNQPRHVRERWRCSDEELRTRNPRAIVVNVSTFGSSGPNAGRAGNGSLAEAYLGLPHHGVPLGDSIGALRGALDVVTALYGRDANGGSGRVLDVSLVGALLPLVAPTHGRGAPAANPLVVGATEDGTMVAISATTDAQRERLRALAGDAVADWLGGRSAMAAIDALTAERVPAVAVADHDTVSRHLAAVRGRAAPRQGEHTDEVVEEWLHGR